jgi:hypothetical protein
VSQIGYTENKEGIVTQACRLKGAAAHDVRAKPSGWVGHPGLEKCCCCYHQRFLQIALGYGVGWQQDADRDLAYSNLAGGTLVHSHSAGRIFKLRTAFCSFNVGGAKSCTPPPLKVMKYCAGHKIGTCIAALDILEDGYLTMSRERTRASRWLLAIFVKTGSSFSSSLLFRFQIKNSARPESAPG